MLLGEGIHTAMVAGKIAAQCVQEMTECDNFSEDACKAYGKDLHRNKLSPDDTNCKRFSLTELRCYDAFGYEFFSSSLAAKIIYAMPIALDAVAVVGQRRGQAFLDFFGEVMTGVRPKSDFAQLGLLCDIGLELLKQVWIQYILRTPPLIPSDIGQEVVNKQAGKKTGGFA